MPWFAERGRRASGRGVAMTRTVGAAVMAAMLVLAATAPAAAQSPTPGGLPAEVALLNTRQIDFTSAVNGHAYRIQVSLPRVPPRHNSR